MNAETSPSVEYARSLYDDVVHWYDNADTKAQVLLTLVGAFTAFLTSSAIIGADELKTITRCMSPLVWGVLLLMAAMVALAVLAGLACLWSRIRLTPETEQAIARTETDLKHRTPGRVIGFFGTLRRLRKERFVTDLQGLDQDYELQIRAAQIHALSGRVYWKHVSVNIGFVSGGLSLLLFLLAAGLYVWNVSDGTCLDQSPATEKGADLFSERAWLHGGSEVGLDRSRAGHHASIWRLRSSLLMMRVSLVSADECAPISLPVSGVRRMNVATMIEALIPVLGGTCAMPLGCRLFSGPNTGRRRKLALLDPLKWLGPRVVTSGLVFFLGGSPTERRPSLYPV